MSVLTWPHNSVESARESWAWWPSRPGRRGLVRGHWDHTVEPSLGSHQSGLHDRQTHDIGQVHITHQSHISNIFNTGLWPVPENLFRGASESQYKLDVPSVRSQFVDQEKMMSAGDLVRWASMFHWHCWFGNMNAIQPVNSRLSCTKRLSCWDPAWHGVISEKNVKNNYSYWLWLGVYNFNKHIRIPDLTCGNNTNNKV